MSSRILDIVSRHDLASGREWIIERPNFGDVGNQPPLANYQHATMTDMFAYVSTNTVTPHDLATDPNVNITLDDLNLNYALSTVAQTGDYSEAFTWVKAK
jgi:hypothetical protein